jgi:cell fate regulator YaaT (PSP1 superfamily)
MRVVIVRFSSSARQAPCFAKGLDLEVGDGCIVESENGPDFGVMNQVVMENPYFGAPDTRLPRVLRRATREDEETYSHKVALETQGREYCLTRIREHDLPMKLGAVERQFDGKKMTFYFTAEGRVDFRELVRDLSARFRTRIELRQIGVRDDAGMQGGYGPCGRSLCCATFLRGFDPVSIRMAKSQGLSLNPSKISGMCGRLMCCLKFEYEGNNAAQNKGRGNKTSAGNRSAAGASSSTPRVS